MKILKSHLKSFIKQEITDYELSNLLNQLGHENEFNNKFFDLDITPNRGDCLSAYGVARDLRNFLKVDLNLDIYQKEIDQLDLNFINNSPAQCPNISFLKIEVEHIKKNYKPYMEKFFTELEVKRNNFFTDISNYLSYEIGQPTHCFDFSKINGQISLEETNVSEEFNTILGSKITISDSNLVFLNQDSIISLAGVMGGEETGCSGETRMALVECAYFLPESIIGKSIKYNLKSDAAHKFERGTDPNFHNFALRRFLKIVEDHAKIVKVSIFSDNKNETKEISIENDLKKVESILGSSVSEDNFKTYLENLDFKVGNFIVPPSYRSDIVNLNDVTEEVARVIGYDSIERKDFQINITKNSEFRKEINNLKAFLIDKGFYEVISFPFSHKEDAKSIEIDNPLDSNKAFLRRNLRTSLIEKLSFNEKRQKDSIKLFEISNIYSIDSDIVEDEVLGIIVSGRQEKNYKFFDKIIDFNFLEEIIKQISPKNVQRIEEVSRETIDSKAKFPIFYFEVSTKEIKTMLSNYDFKSKIRFHNIKYEEISEFPSTYRDISFEISSKKSMHQLIEFLEDFNNTLVKEKFIFDYYENNKINKIKLGFRIIFQSNKKTLTDSEVNIIFNDIVKSSKKINGIDIPGL